MWFNRNKLIHGDSGWDGQELVNFSKDYIRHFREAQLQFQTPRPPESPVEWNPPSGSTLKLNFDASVAVSSWHDGLGIVARNSAGEVVAWKRKRVDFIVDPEVLEARAALVCVELALEKRWSTIMIEGDCIAVIQALNSTDPCLSPGGLIIEAIKRKCVFFNSVRFSHVFRSGNVLAHRLAKGVLVDSEGESMLPF